jgi:HSP20 family molecular chaperone IbpA
MGNLTLNYICDNFHILMRMCIKSTLRMNNTIEISANIEKSNEQNSTKFFKQEKYVERLYRAFSLPNYADMTSLDQKYENGILTITIKKK